VLRLRSDQMDAFYDTGFVVQPDVFSPVEVASMCDAFDRLEATARRLGSTTMHDGSQFVLDAMENGGIKIHRIVWCGAAEPVLSEFGRDQRLVEMAGQLLASRSMNQLINQAHFKRPGDGVAFPWHQDSTHRRYGMAEWKDVNGRGSYVQTLTALDDIGEDNGPLFFIPGGHARGHLDIPPDGSLPSWVDPRTAVPAIMRAGSVLLFGPYSIHGSRANTSLRPRRTFINGFAYPGANARVYPGEGAGRLLSCETDPLDGRESRIA
jgi:ectoine hydroxylase-related dioxygenase (phytanoyl-CoA dioxygenase family)